MWKVVFCCIVNCAFSMWIGAGMDSISAARSPWGVAMGSVVGALWVVGYIARISLLASSWVCSEFSDGSGRASACWLSSISVSL
jgi:hypothetical protein